MIALGSVPSNTVRKQEMDPIMDSKISSGGGVGGGMSAVLSDL